MSVCKLTYTPGELSCLTYTHSYITHTFGLQDDLSSYISPLLWFLFQVLNQRGHVLVGGREREAEVVGGGEGKGPHLRGTAVWQ